MGGSLNQHWPPSSGKPEWCVDRPARSESKNVLTVDVGRRGGRPADVDVPRAELKVEEGGHLPGGDAVLGIDRLRQDPDVELSGFGRRHGEAQVRAVQRAIGEGAL